MFIPSLFSYKQEVPVRNIQKLIVIRAAYDCFPEFPRLVRQRCKTPRLEASLVRDQFCGDKLSIRIENFQSIILNFVLYFVHFFRNIKIGWIYWGRVWEIPLLVNKAHYPPWRIHEIAINAIQLNSKSIGCICACMNEKKQFTLRE